MLILIFVDKSHLVQVFLREARVLSFENFILAPTSAKTSLKLRPLIPSEGSPVSSPLEIFVVMSTVGMVQERFNLDSWPVFDDGPMIRVLREL